MSRPVLSDAALWALYVGTHETTRGDKTACLRAIYEAGREQLLQLPHNRERARFLRARYQDVFDAVCACYEVDMAKVLSKYGRHHGTGVLDAHRELCWLLRNALDESEQLSYPAIGRIVNRDHSSVMSLVRRTDTLIAARPEYRDELVAMLSEQGAKRAVVAR